MGATDIGVNTAICFLTFLHLASINSDAPGSRKVMSYQTWSTPEVVRSIRQFFELLSDEHGEPMLSVGIILI